MATVPTAKETRILFRNIDEPGLADIDLSKLKFPPGNAR